VVFETYETTALSQQLWKKKGIKCQASNNKILVSFWPPDHKTFYTTCLRGSAYYSEKQAVKLM